MTSEDRAEQVRRDLDVMNYYEGTKRRDACVANHLREHWNAAVEACAQKIKGFRTGGPTPDTWTAWGEGLASEIRTLKE